VTLLLRPPGRGNWSPVVVALEGGKNAPLPLEVHVGQRLTIAGRVFRIARVLP
jgi:hypothetical protein